MNMNNVAVLLSTYNGEKYLRELLDSVFSQKDVNLTLFVRDDGSSDKTVEILEEYKKKGFPIDISSGEGNLGYAKSFSTLIQNIPSTFDYYACCDQDDVWLPNKLSDAISEIQKVEKDDKPILFHTSCIITDENLKEITRDSHPHYSRQTDTRFEESLLMTNINGCTAVFNNALKNLYTKVPMNRIIGHDFTLCTLASAFGEVIFSDNSAIYYRQHKNNSFGYFKYSLLRSLKNFFKHETKSLRTHEAKMIKDLFYDKLSDHNKYFIDLVLNYKQNGKSKRALKRYIKKNIKNKTVRTYSYLVINLGKL